MALSVKNKDNVLNFIGFIFLVFGLFAIINSIYIHNPNQILWSCYVGLILLSFGVFKRNGTLIGAEICVLLIPSLFWDIDFLYQLILHEPLWGTTNYMFTGEIGISKIISLQHFFTVPLAIFSLYFIKTKNLDFWKVAVVQVTLVFLAIHLITEPQENINCVFESCVPIDLGISHSLSWFFVYFFIIVSTNALLNKLQFLRK